MNRNLKYLVVTQLWVIFISHHVKILAKKTIYGLCWYYRMLWVFLQITFNVEFVTK